MESSMESNTKSNMESIAESNEANKAPNTEPSKTGGIIGAEEFSSFYPDISLKELLHRRNARRRYRPTRCHRHIRLLHRKGRVRSR